MKTPSLEFQRLKDELSNVAAGTSAGFHDLHHASVEALQSHHEVVTRHEAYHDRLFTETPFGTLQFLFRRLLMVAVDQDLVRSVSRWLEELHAASCYTHESTATYCAVKSFSAAEIPEILGMHPPQYRAYYEAYSSLVDPVFKSTYLQYLAGMTVSEICLVSRIQERLSRADVLSTPRLDDLEKPDERFRVLCSSKLDQAFLLALEHLLAFVREQRDELCLTPEFNAQSEADWLRLSVDVARNLDERLQDEMRHILYEHASQIMPCLFHHEWMPPRRRLLGLLTELAGTDILGPPLGDAVPAKAPEDPDMSRRARRAANSVLTNASAVDLRNLGVHQNVELMGLLKGPEGKRILFADLAHAEDPAHPDWLAIIDSESSATVRRVDSASVSRFFRLRGVLGCSALPIPSPHAIIVCVRLDQAFVDFYRDIVNIHSHGEVTIKIENLVWYMKGNLFSWLNWMIEQGDTEYMLIYGANKPIQHIGTTLEDIREKYRTISLQEAQSLRQAWTTHVRGHALRCSGVQGVFLRWYTAGASEMITCGLAEYTLKTVPEAERPRLGEPCLASLPILASFSREF